MLIKNRSLYFTVPFQVFLSLFLSIAFFAVFAFSADFILLNLFGVNTEEQKIETDRLVTEIQTRITENSLTFDDAEEVAELWSGSGYTLHFLSSRDDYAGEDLTIINDTYFIYDIEFSDTTGSVLIISNIIRTQYMTYFGVLICLSIVLFLVLILKEMSRIISKIHAIKQGVDIIANDDLQHKIEISGEKELLSLAQNINNMGETIFIKNQNEHREELSKRILITNLSHDIRTPLTSISGYLDLILVNPEQRESIVTYASTAKKNSLRMQKLIDDLFLYSKLISGDIKPKLEEYSISRLILQTIELREQDIIIDSLASDTLILTDLNNFQRVISNLLDNAEKYKSTDADITINNYNGTGFTYIEIQNKTDEDLSEKINLLTNRLYKSDENRKDSSSGLGLSIVTELLKTFNSTLELSFCNQIFTAKIKTPIKR